MRGVVVVDTDDAVGGLQIGEGVVVEEVLQHQQRVEQRAAGIACGALDLAEAEMVVAHHRHPLFTDGPHRIGRRTRGGQVDPHRHGVEEQADRLVDADQLAGAAGHGGADDDIGGARVVAGDQSPPRRSRRH